MLFSMVAVLVCIPTNSVRGFPLLRTLSSIYCLLTFWRWPFWPVWDCTSLWFWFAFLWWCHSSILTWRIPRTEEPGRLESTGSQRVRRDYVTNNKCLVLLMTGLQQTSGLNFSFFLPLKSFSNSLRHYFYLLTILAFPKSFILFFVLIFIQCMKNNWFTWLIWLEATWGHGACLILLQILRPHPRPWMNEW